MYPIFDKVRNTHPNLRAKFSSTFESLDRIYEAWFKDKEAFAREYRKLIPETDKKENLVFGHCDT